MNDERPPTVAFRDIVGLAMKVHRRLGPEFLESVYQNALLVELKRAGIAAASQHGLKVVYEGVVVGEFAADLLIDGSLLVELKAARARRTRPRS